MVKVEHSVLINAPVERVFGLMANPVAKASLNPLIEPIRVEIEGQPELGLGSTCHYRLQFGRVILDYHGRVTAFERNHLIESVTDSDPPLTIKVTTAPEDGATRLTQTEVFEASDAVLENALPSSVTDRVMSAAYRIFAWTDIDAATRIREQREARLGGMLSRQLQGWLENAKSHLEEHAR